VSLRKSREQTEKEKILSASKKKLQIEAMVPAQRSFEFELLQRMCIQPNATFRVQSGTNLWSIFTRVIPILNI
jgi:hypothetical protein